MGPQKIAEFIVYYALVFSLSFASVFVLIFKIIQNGFQVFQVQLRMKPPPILTHERWGRHQYVKLQKQGIKLHYVEKGNQSKPLLLCLHGFPECWFSWRHQLEEFSSEFWVVAVDMRGYGDSDKPPKTSDYKLEYIVEDIRELLYELDRSKCSLMAHDWGSIIAWSLVEKYPHLFERHISLNGPNLSVFRKVITTSFTQLKKSWYTFFFQCQYMPEILFRLKDLSILEESFRGPKNLVESFPDDVMEGYKYYYSKKGAFTPPLNYYRCLSVGMEPEEKMNVVPTLIIWGTEDIALSKEIPARMTKICQDVQLKMVEGAGHFVHEEEPKYVNELIWEYIRITS